MISTHILDTSVGEPAADVKVTLEKFNDGQWVELAEAKTNEDGRHAFDIPYEAGKYRIQFHTVDYFIKKNQQNFFLDTPVAFEVKDTNRKYHVPLLLNPFGYSTYRGS
jgi:hydroxyisourate hydrolase